MKRVFCLFGVFMTLFVSAAWSQSASLSANAKRKELQDVERQLEQKKREIEEYRRETELLKRDISHLVGEQSVWRGKIRTLDRKILLAENIKTQLKTKIGALELAEDRWHEVLAREMNGYLRQNLLEFDYYGNEDLWEEPFRRAAIVEKVRYIRDLSGFKIDVQKAAAEATQQKTKLQTKTAEVVAERRNREALYQQKEEAYLETQMKFVKTLKDVQELQDSAAALTQLVKSLERKTHGKPETRTAFPLVQPSHSLPWPVDGRVVSLFGRRYLPQIHTWEIHQGISLATDLHAPVHPVKTGKVIFAGPFRSYGKVIIVDHGSAFYTIYGRLGEMFSKPGDHVKPSDVLGTAESSGSGGTVYFEIRQSVDALDPIAWLRRR